MQYRHTIWNKATKPPSLMQHTTRFHTFYKHYRIKLNFRAAYPHIFIQKKTLFCRISFDKTWFLKCTYRNQLFHPLSVETQCNLLQSTHPLGSNPVRSKPGTTLGHLDLCGKRRRRGNPFRIIAYSLLGALKWILEHSVLNYRNVIDEGTIRNYFQRF